MHHTPFQPLRLYHRNLNTNGKQTDNGQSKCYIFQYANVFTIPHAVDTCVKQQ